MTVYHYQAPAGASAGRTICALLRRVKEMGPQDRCYFYGSAQLTISGNLQVILRKYRSRLKTINLWGSGPYRQKTTPRFFKRMIRGMLPYKTYHGARMYKKIIIDPAGPKPVKCEVLPVKILQLRQEHSLSEIVRKI